MTSPAPQLTVRSGRGDIDAVVLVLHGGRETSTAVTRATQLAVLRLIPFARRIYRRGGGRVAVARLRYAVRGWNDTGGRPAPVLDAQWALDQLSSRFPDRPIGLVGHSMGGRTAMRVAGHSSVRAVVGLAPWLPPGEPLAQLTGRDVLLVHGTADRMTDPRRTAAVASALSAAGVAVELIEIPGEKHAMLHRPRLWHRLAADFVVDSLLPGSAPSGGPAAPNHPPEISRSGSPACR